MNGTSGSIPSGGDGNSAASASEDSSGGSPGGGKAASGRATRPSSQHEFPIWLMRTTAARVKHAVSVIWFGPQYKRLARFSYDMWTCSRSSTNIAQSLELCVRPHAGSRIGDCWVNAAAQIRSGGTLVEALRPAERYLPAFYLPVVDAGEQSGRLDEAFEFLHNHCNLLAGPAQSIRNVWLFPLVILLAGSVIRVGMFLVTGYVRDGLATLITEIGSWIQLAIILAVVFLTPVRLLVDEIRLRIPWLGELEREICVVRFCRVMSLMYGVSAGRVENMIHTASEAVGNRAARNDLEKAATAVMRGATISDAFQGVQLLSDDERSMIEVGEYSGSLENAFTEIADQAEASMMPKLHFIQPILTRIVMAVVTLSIVSTMLQIAFRG